VNLANVRFPPVCDVCARWAQSVARAPEADMSCLPESGRE
jgi:hypothetical protein